MGVKQKKVLDKYNVKKDSVQIYKKLDIFHMAKALDASNEK